MLLRLFMCNIILIPMIFGSNITQNTNNNTTKSLLAKANTTSQSEGITNLTINTEGGIARESTPPVTLPKQSLLSVDKELGKDKSVSTSASNVKARKGVEYHAENNTKPEDAITVKEVASNVKNHLKGEQAVLNKNSSVTTEKHDIKIETNTSTTIPVKVKKPLISTTTPVKVKKPLILSNEALDKMDNQMQIPMMQSSVETVVHNQMPSPNRDGPTKRIEPMSASRHPGMIMPVVITILVVPMFAVLGYMALRRGQEAWKNRHYKRMDFLLDGMYNE